MGTVIDLKLDEIGAIFGNGLDTEGTLRILRILDGPTYSQAYVEELTLYSELLPLGREKPFTREQRYFHFLWDAFDKLPICGCQFRYTFPETYRRAAFQKMRRRLHCGGEFSAQFRAEYRGWRFCLFQPRRIC